MKNGTPVKMRVTSIALGDIDRRRLKALAKAKRWSMSLVIRTAIEHFYVMSQGKKGK